MSAGGKLVVIIIVVIVVFAAFRAISSQTVTFRSTVNSFQVRPNNVVRVYFTLTNTGNTAGSPSCVVQVLPTDPSGNLLSGLGTNGFSNGPTVRPGHSYRAYIDVVVSNNDARFVTSKSMISITGC